jgi:hypothetical protein
LRVDEGQEPSLMVPALSVLGVEDDGDRGCSKTITKARNPESTKSRKKVHHGVTEITENPAAKAMG